MAKVLKITDGTNTVDFLTGNYRLFLDGFTAETTLEPAWVTFYAVSTATDANIRTEQVKLDKLFRKARLYMNQVIDSTPVWLYFQSEGESAKRALVYDGRTSIEASESMGPMLGENAVQLTIAVLRAPDYETTTAANDWTDSPISTLGGQWDPSGSLDVSDSDNRINQLEIDNPGAGATITRVWVGIRPTRNGVAGLIPLWEAEDGTNGTDATDTVDATASGGYKVAVSFATATSLTRRITLQWSDTASSNYDDIIGEYLVLARLKIDADTTEVRVQMRHGWGGSTMGAEIVGDTFFSGVEDDTLDVYQLHELGRVRIPPTGNRDSIYTLKIADYSIELWAERISVAGSLDIDCLVLIPVEHFAFIDNATINNSGGSVRIYTGPDGHQWADTITATSGVTGQVEFSPENWYYPTGGGQFVIAAQASGSHALSRTIDLDMEIYPAWKIYRTS